MNYEFFIANRLVFSRKKAKSYSKPIIRIAIIGMALGFAVMIITISIVTGFKKEIREKVIGFGAHIQISNYDENNSYETKPISRQQKFLQSLKDDAGIKNVQVFATKAGIIKTENEIEGVVAKGIGSDFDWSYFSSYLVSGKKFLVNDSTRSDEIVISENLSKKLNLKAGDHFIMNFIQQPPRARKFRISGIYKTGLEEFDNLFVLCDISQIQRLNDWTSDEVGGFEITLKNFDQLDQYAEKIYSHTGSNLNSRSVVEIYPQIFDWLNLQNINAIVIITLMIIVCGMNMISALLIIILERIDIIGILKALGSKNVSIRKIFIYISGYLISRGLVFGNLIGIAIILIQKNFGIFHLDQQSYYLSYVPINFSIFHILLLNVGIVIICVLMMILPTLIISRINPIVSMRYS